MSGRREVVLDCCANEAKVLFEKLVKTAYIEGRIRGLDIKLKRAEVQNATREDYREDAEEEDWNLSYVSGVLEGLLKKYEDDDLQE